VFEDIGKGAEANIGEIELPPADEELDPLDTLFNY
jgi:hypothetical protein